MKAPYEKLLSNENEIINEILNKYEDHSSIQLIKSQSQVNLGKFKFRRDEKDNIRKILINLNPIWHGLFFNHQSLGGGGGGGGHEAPYHNFVDIDLMIMKFGTCVKLDVFYTMVIKKLVKSLLLGNYDVITCI